MDDSNIVAGSLVPSELLADINVPLFKFIVNAAKSNVSSICMIDAVTDEKLSVGRVLSESLVLAGELQALGCKPGVVVGVICENGLEYGIILLAVLRTGATLACFNPAYSIGELEHTVNVTQPYLLFVDASSSKKLSQLSTRSEQLKYVISLEENTVSPIVSYRSLFSRKIKSNYIAPEVNEGNTVLILFSSGSTGLPKGVMLSNRNLVFLMSMIKYGHKMLVDYEYTLLSVIPMFHGYGIFLILRLLICGGKVINLKKFNDQLFLSAIEKYKVTDLALVPSLMVFLAKHPLVNNYNLSTVRTITCGAAPLSVKIENEVVKKIKLNGITKGYGMTETSILCMRTAPGIDDKPGSVGKLLPGMLVKVIDLETGQSLGPNKEGEICIKGMLVMQGYYNNKTETDNAIDPDGWLHTGDVGYYDDDEDFFIVDRIKDLIKYKGFQVAPAELESLLLKHDAVKDAAVVGVPDEIAGEVPRAFVVKLKDITENELQEYIAGQVAPHMKLRGGVKFIKEIPRNTNGKILRRNLRNWSQSKL